MKWHEILFGFTNLELNIQNQFIVSDYKYVGMNVTELKKGLKMKSKPPQYAKKKS